MTLTTQRCVLLARTLGLHSLYPTAPTPALKPRTRKMRPCLNCGFLLMLSCQPAPLVRDSVQRDDTQTIFQPDTS
ncbi:hypothetical protein ACLEIY_00030 [Acetobacter tropicalis]|uniref:hypothetical protein n=1 Tax=Acetobacter tropicalis TaxID=104102 RepID=UPI0039760325